MRGLLIVLSVALVSITGIPVWFQLTRIYRPSLPRERISELRKRVDSKLVKIPINYTIWMLESSDTINTSLSKKLVESETLLDKNSTGMNIKMRLVVVKEKECLLYPLDAKTPNAIFDCPFTREELVHAASTVSSEEFDVLLDASVGSTPGNYHLFVLPSDIKFAGAVVGSHRHSWIIPSSVEQMEAEVIAFSNHLQREFYSSVINVANQLIRASSDILLSFTLCNSDVGHGYWHWNFARFESEWLMRTIQQLNRNLHITIESQVIYDCDIILQPEWSVNMSVFLLKETQLAFFVNQEWDVDPTNIIRPDSNTMHTSLASIPHLLHFLVYIPPVDFSPLTIASTKGKSQTFWIPSWGGVVILNKDYLTNNQTPVQQGELTEDDYQLLAESFVSQLRMLAGFSEEEEEDQSSDIKVLSSLYRAFTNFEIDEILKSKIEFNVKTTVHVLNAFIQLVDKIPNLEVPDSIQQQVLDAVEAMEHGLGLLESGEGDLNEANEVIYNGLLAAEAAFSHPSIASIENFPDEHKLGIYLPLFLPVLITMVLALLQETRKAFVKRS